MATKWGLKNLSAMVYNDGKPGYAAVKEDLSSNKKHWHTDFAFISVSMQDGLFTTEEHLPNFVQSRTKNTG